MAGHQKPQSQAIAAFMSGESSVERVAGFEIIGSRYFPA
jgi:hypothetical protein